GGGHDWTGHDDGSRALPGPLAEAIDDRRFLRPRNPQNPDGVTPEQIERYGEGVAATGLNVRELRIPLDKGASIGIGNRFDVGDDVHLGVIGAFRYNNAWHHGNESRRSYITSASGLFVKDALDVEDTR